MSSLTQIELPNGTTYDIEDAKKKGVYVVKGTHTTATVAWTGAIDIPALYDGLTIAYYLPISATSGSTQVTLNLTLSGGTTTGAINCYYNASKLTRSYYPAGSSILMTYWSAGSISISGTATTDNRWIAGADYNANTWRNIQVNGTQLLSTSTSSGVLNLVSGTNATVSGSGNNVTISATDTNTIAGMTDVQLTSPTDNDLLVYDSNLSGGKTWKNAKKIVTCTKSQFDAWSANNSFPYTDCKYIVTDAPNTNGTSEDLSYDGGVTSTHDMIEAVRDLIYPVGSIYLSVTDSTVASVQARFGGTWVAFGAGRTLVGVNTSDTDFNTVEKTGGEKKHTLSTNEIPRHNHGIGLNQTGSAHFNGFWHLKLTTGADIKNTNADETIGDTSTTFVGDGQSHNNLSPYITVYMYKRTA